MLRTASGPAAPRIHSPGLSFAFTPEEIEAARRGGLLSMDIQLTHLCNFRCRYCYATPNERVAGELQQEEVLKLVDEATALGLRTLTLTGGEPLLDKKFFPAARHAFQRGIQVLMFTNASRITREIAQELFNLRISPCVKLDSLSPATQNHLAAKEGSHSLILNGLRHLIAAGYTRKLPLAINAAVCRDNLHEIPELWRWARANRITPSISRLQWMGRAQETSGLEVSPAELHHLYQILSDIDRSFGFLWEPDIPWHGGRACVRYHIGCFIDATGNVQPCSGVPVKAGNIRHQPLATILSESEVFQVARNIRRALQGACASCPLNSRCYGCRSIAYFSTGSFVASDPSCWRVASFHKNSSPPVELECKRCISRGEPS